MNRAEIFTRIQRKNSYLCVGLDTDPDQLPSHLLTADDPVFEFNRQIIDATHDYCIAYKPNTAFYEARGAKGWESLQKTLEYIPKDVLTIADAKRGDLDNTAKYYAKAFFKHLGVDAITLSPYMGEDSVKPYLAYDNKWVILLAHTSNSGSADFQTQELKSGRKLYEEVIVRSQAWANADRIMYVMGATHPATFAGARKLAPDHFFLAPGVGAQGGDLEAVSRAGMNSQCGLLVNSSRAIIYASNGKDFGQAAARQAKAVQQEMQKCLNEMIR